jgi:hypothetical protein
VAGAAEAAVIGARGALSGWLRDKDIDMVTARRPQADVAVQACMDRHGPEGFAMTNFPRGCPTTRNER